MAGSGATLTHEDLEKGSARLARWLVDHGLRPGDPIALLADNSARLFEVYWATQRCGLLLTAVNHHLTPGEVAYIVRDCGAKALVVAGSLRPLAAAVGMEVPEVGVRLAYGPAVPGFADYDTALDGVADTPLDEEPAGAVMLYSSGTTGRPKGVRPPMPRRRIDEPGDRSPFATLYGFGPDTVYLSPGPLYHAAPLRFSALVQELGGTVVVMERFDAEGALATIERYRATHSQWVPTMFVRMLKLPPEMRTRYDLSSMRVAIHAAAPCPIDVKRAMIDWWGPVIYEYYAATEAVGMTFIDSAQWLERPGSVGRAGLGEVRIADAETGALLPPGRVGTIYFERHDGPLFSYHNDPEKTRASRHPEHDNWGTTGDLGYLDEQGWLYLTDRQAFMIISGGVNIYPRDVEDALALHPAVLDVAVIGVADPDMGEAVLAVVQPDPHVVPGPELERELIAHTRTHIAAFKAPRRVVFTDDMPRTPTGKLVKQKLRDRYGVVSE
jgi:acyl-CoA synthetase (AMP-forming)/AMP-acid ligase II